MKISKEKLFSLMATKGLTARDLHCKSGISENAISKMLNGKSSNTRPSTIGKLSKALECSPEDLTRG